MKTVPLTLLASITVAATGGTTESFSGSFDLATTNWSETFQITGFDTMGGTRELTGLDINLSGEVRGMAMAESLDASSASIQLNLQATLTLLLAATNTELAEVIPVVNTTFNAQAFDGEIDFDGQSGALFGGLQDTASVSTGVTDAAVLALFSDVGSVGLSAEALGSSFGSGAGNLITQFATEAGFAWDVTYRYQEVPAPAGLAVLGMGGLVATRRRR